MDAESRHPSLGQLEAFADGELEPAEAARLASHFAACADCRQLAEDLRGLAQGTPEPPESSPVWGESEMQGALAQLRQRILAEDLVAGGSRDLGGRESAVILPFEPRTAAAAASGSALPRWRHLAPWVGAAAGVLLGVGVAWERQQEVERLGVELAAATGQAEELRAAARRPLANPVTVEAAPLDDPLRGSAQPAPASTGGFAVEVRSSSEPFPAGSWRAVIENREGKLELEVNDLKSNGGQLEFFLLPGSLPAGEHRVRVYQGETPWPQVFAFDLGDG